MGQQQLLLIVLGVIIVGIAVVAGINLFVSNSASSNRDAIVTHLLTLGSNAQLHYRKPIPLGGGGISFTNWTIPAGLSSNANGTFTATVTATSVTLVGVGNQTGNDGSTNVKVTMVIGPYAVTSTTINN
jgi:hypothetical protein